MVCMKILQNGRLARFSKRKDCWCAFSLSICNQMGTLFLYQSSSFQGYECIHKSWEDIISWEEQWLKTKTKWKRSLLKRSVSKNHRTIAPKVTAELSIHFEDPVSTKTVWLELHKSSVQGRVAIGKCMITEKKLKGKKDGMMIIKPGHRMFGNTSHGQTSRPSCCSQYHARFLFGECPRKPVLLNA